MNKYNEYILLIDVLSYYDRLGNSHGRFDEIVIRFFVL